jgi:hypothetical protein
VSLYCTNTKRIQYTISNFYFPDLGSGVGTGVGFDGSLNKKLAGFVGELNERKFEGFLVGIRDGFNVEIEVGLGVGSGVGLVVDTELKTFGTVSEDDLTRKAMSSTSSYEPFGQGLASPLNLITTRTAWRLPLPKVYCVERVLAEDEIGLTVSMNCHCGFVASIA